MTREEAIRRIKAWNLDPDDMEVLSVVIPELAESENERIRKELIEFIQWSIDRHFMREDFYQAKRPSEWLAYLEKQKEPPMSAEGVLVRAGLKPYKDGNQWCVLAGDNIQEGICGFGDTIDEALYQFLMEVLEKQKETGIHWFKSDNVKNPDKPYIDKTGRFYTTDSRMCHVSEIEKQKELSFVKDVVLGYPGLYFYDGERMHFRGSPAMEEKQKEQKPVEPSNDELQRHQDELYDFKVFAAKQAKEHHISFVHDFEWNNFCAELLSYFNKHESAEWSEEDEEKIVTISEIIEHCTTIPYSGGTLTLNKEYKKELLCFIKSLRPQPKRDCKNCAMFLNGKCTKPHWKPSEEQVEALEDTMTYIPEFYKPKSNLASLLRDLKKQV